MEIFEIKQLASEGIYRNFSLNASIIETHISWVLISKEFVFKIKKPIKLPFLDFSTLTLRKHYCIRELILNQAYSAIYLDVLPIRKINGKFQIGEGKGVLIDYTVRMKRMEAERRMDFMLENSSLTIKHLEALSTTLAEVHQKAEKIYSEFRFENLKNLFSSFAENKHFVMSYLGKDKATIIDKSIEWSQEFLVHHQTRMKQRSEKGFIRFLHGDLHSRNIFISKTPVIFDCIEFDDTLREIDVLDEIGFLSMDIEAHNAPELSKYLVKTYIEKTGAIQCDEDFEILQYYKCYRATLRFKVLLIGAMQQIGASEFSKELTKAEKYLNLVEFYIS